MLDRVMAVVMVALLGSACGGSSDAGSRRLRRAPPASAKLTDLLPEPTPPSAPPYASGSRLALRASSGPAPLLGGAQLNSYEVAAVVLDDDPAHWRFALGEDALRAALGADRFEAGVTGVAAALHGFLSNSELHGALAQSLQSHPTLHDLDPSGAWDVAGLRIVSMTLNDAVFLDTDSDGSLETPASMLTVEMTLPSATTATPVAPLPDCATLIGDGTAAATFATESGHSWVPPAQALWRWRVSVVAHFILSDLSPAHAAMWESTSYPSQGERDAASFDLGVLAGFLRDPAAGLSGADLIVTVEPDPELAASTLHVIASLARTAGDTACLRQVDGWLAEVALLQPSLSDAQVAGAAPAGYLLQAYSPEVDSADGIVDPGLTCLHDASGHPVQIGGDPACATSSGALESAPGRALSGPSATTPYSRKVSIPEIAPCTSSPWSEICTDRFGRGIKLCLAEWALRNQVGDYWNIHWWQNGRKAATQTAIKAAGYLLRGAIYVYMGEGEILPRIYLAAAKEGTAYLADLATNSTNSSVAGHGVSFAGGKLYDMLLKGFMKSGQVTKEPNVVASWTIDHVVDGLAQMAEVEAVGWQDYSNASHCVCGFEFSHPNYCD